MKPTKETNNLQKDFFNYRDTIYRVFANINIEIAVSLVSDPELENSEQIEILLKADSNVETIIKLNDILYSALDTIVDEAVSEFFVISFEIV